MSSRDKFRRPRVRPQTPSWGGPARVRGFTIIELMISMVLLSVVLTLVYTTFFQISSGARILSTQLDQQQEIRLLMKMVGDDLQGARFLTNFAQYENPTGIEAEYDTLLGEDFTKIRFHSVSQSRFQRHVLTAGDPGVHEVAYWVEFSEKDDQLLLLKRREDFYLDDDMDSGGVSTVILKGVKAFQIEFLPASQRAASAETARWETSWNSNSNPAGEKMPLALRITVAQEGELGGILREIHEVNLVGSLTVGK